MKRQMKIDEKAALTVITSPKQFILF